MAGKVITSTLSNVKHLPRVDAIWQITRTGQDAPGMVRRRDLSPSDKLNTKWSRTWKSLPASQWWQKYTDLFRMQLQEKETLEAMRELYRTVIAGQTIALVCSCNEPVHCHRHLLAGFLQEHGVTVEEVMPPPDLQTYLQL